MTISFTSILSDLFTFASAAKVAGGAFCHKLYADIKAYYAKAKAEAAKVEADVKADVKKL